MSHSVSSLTTATFGDSTLSASRTIAPGGFTRLRPPFALDFELEEFKDVLTTETLDDDGESVVTDDFENSTGYRVGGPKEARLRRVAMLAPPRDLDGLYPIKIRIDPKKKIVDLRLQLEKELGDIKSLKDIYIPEDIERGLPAVNFAVLRFSEEETAEDAIESFPRDRNIEASYLKEQKTFFTKNTGALGISNTPIGEISTVGRVIIEQDVEFDQCMARNGAPWTSCRELKSLAPHKGAAILEYPAIKIQNLLSNVTPDEISEYFERYGRVMDVKCPKPLQVNLRIDEPNCGFGFIRFKDKRDLDDALIDLKAGKISFHGQVATGVYTPPSYWPEEKTRRYY